MIGPFVIRQASTNLNTKGFGAIRDSLFITHCGNLVEIHRVRMLNTGDKLSRNYLFWSRCFPYPVVCWLSISIWRRMAMMETMGNR